MSAVLDLQVCASFAFSSDLNSVSGSNVQIGQTRQLSLMDIVGTRQLNLLANLTAWSVANSHNRKTFIDLFGSG